MRLSAYCPSCGFSYETEIDQKTAETIQTEGAWKFMHRCGRADTELEFEVLP